MSNSVPLTDIPKDWVIGELKEFLSFISYGFTNPMPESAVGPYMVTAKDVTGLKIQYGSARKTTSDAFENLLSNKSRPQKNDLLLTKDGTLGRVAIVDREGICINQSVAVLRVNEKLSSMFLLQLLASPVYQRVMLDNAGGSAIKHIYITTVDKMKVAIPCDREQQKIAAILTSVDEVIEKTQAQIDKLKDLKTGMMQQLLTSGVGVDGKPHTEFKDSVVGRIPKGWEVLPLSKVAKLERGKFSHRPRNDPAFYSGNIPFLQTGDIPKKSPYIQRFSQTLNEKGLGVSKLFPVGSLVITIAATIGEVGILEFESCFPDSLVGIKVNPEKANAMYVLYVMRHMKSELDLLAPQTAQKNINLDILNPFCIPVPPLSEQRIISKSLESIDSRLNILQRKLDQRMTVKKALMQDLLTGKVRVTVPESSTGH